MNAAARKNPKLLPWLARKAGIGDRRAEVLWHEAQRYARLRTGERDAPAFHRAAMDRLVELMTLEASREDAACFGLRHWARLNAALWRAPIAVYDAAALSAARSWRLFGHAIG